MPEAIPPPGQITHAEHMSPWLGPTAIAGNAHPSKIAAHASEIFTIFAPC
jgi:hypothetical protein